tara:strand:- start:13 stop:2667 length:2655 start_codon:yes stop_codon:yes gene_type:complete
MSYTLKELEDSLIKADAAGNVDDAKVLTKEILNMRNNNSTLGLTQQLLAGFNETLFYFPDAGIKSIAKGLAKAGMIEDDEVNGLADFFNKGVREPSTSAERILRTTGSELAKNTPITGGALGLATTKLYTGAKTTTEAVVKSLLDQFRKSPLAASVAETAAATGFGVGKGLAEEERPDSELAQITFPLVGALTPGAATTVLAKTPTAIAVRAGNKIKEYFGTKAQEARATKETFDRFAAAYGEPAAQEQLRRTQQVRDQIGDDFVPSPAEASGSPQLIASQKELENNASGSQLDALVRRKIKNTKAIEGNITKNFPTTGDEAPFVINTITKKFDDLSNINNLQLAKSSGRLDDITKDFPIAETAIAGQKLRNILLDKRNIAKQDFNDYVKQLNIDMNASVSFAEFKTNFVKMYAPDSKFADVANRPSIYNEVKNFKQSSIAFKDIQGLRERVSDDLLDALGTASPSSKKIRTLSMMKKDIDTFIDDNVEILGNKYKMFRNAYKERIINRFEKSAAYSSQRLGKTQEYKIADEKVADAFLTNVQSAKQFKEVFTDTASGEIDADALLALESVVLDKVRKTAFANDVLDPKKLNKYINNNKQVLEQFPTILNKLTDSQVAISFVSNRVAQLNNRKALIQDNMLAKKLMFGQSPIMKGEVDVDKLLTSAIKQPALMKQINARLKTADEKEALRRSVAKIMFEVNDPALNPAVFKQFLESNKNSLNSVYSADHINNLNIIADAYAINARTPMPQGIGTTTPGVVQEATQQMGMSIPSIMSRFYAAESGRTSVRYIASDIFGRFILTKGKQRADALFYEAMFDPNIAKDYARFATDKVENKLITKKLNGYLFNLGYPSDEENQGLYTLDNQRFNTININPSRDEYQASR